MSLIEAQLCSIDQSDLFIAWRRGGGSIQHLCLLFFPPAFPFPAYISPLQPARMSTPSTPGKMQLVKSSDPAWESNLSLPRTSNSFVHEHVVFLPAFVCFCSPPVSPPLPASPRQARDTPAMLNPRSGDR